MQVFDLILSAGDVTMKKGDLISSFAQIIILIVILPFVFMIIDVNTLMNFIQGIPIFDVWTQVLYNYHTVSADSLMQIYSNSFFDAVILGICVHVMNGLGNLLEMRGLPVLTTFLGIAAGCIFIKILGISQSLYLTVVVFVIIIGIMFMLKAILPGLKVFSLKSFLMLIIESILAVIMCGYVVALKLCSQGVISSAHLISICAVCIVALVVTFIVGRLAALDGKY